jgi:hypothetical protein
LGMQKLIMWDPTTKGNVDTSDSTNDLVLLDLIGNYIPSGSQLRILNIVISCFKLHYFIILLRQKVKSNIYTQVNAKNDLRSYCSNCASN